eukprot:bmy_21682T0
MLGWRASAPDLEEDGQGGTRHKGSPYLVAGLSWHLPGLVGPQPPPEAPALLAPSFHEGSTVCPDVPSKRRAVRPGLVDGSVYLLTLPVPRAESLSAAAAEEREDQRLSGAEQDQGAGSPGVPALLLQPDLEGRPERLPAARTEPGPARRRGRRPGGQEPAGGGVAPAELQHHPAAPPGCQPAAQHPPAPLVLAPCDGTLLVSGLQKELGLGPGPLLPPPLLQAGGSPVASAAQLLDAHLRISSSTAPGPAAAAPQPRFATLSPSLEPAGLPQGDCEMEDLTSGPLGTFVLVQ